MHGTEMDGAKLDSVVPVDLELDKRLRPCALSNFEKSELPQTSVSLADSLITEQTYAIGSSNENDKVFYPHGDIGIFGCVFEAWKHHWKLRTRPEDWWFPAACRIAKAVDTAAKREHVMVRNLFVSHQGQEHIVVPLNIHTIYEANYDYLFATFSKEVQNKIKIPEYAQVMQNDFGTSGPEHTVASQINLMASVQKFFSFEMRMCGCGLSGLEMKGEEADWDNLVVKLKKVRALLKPIENELELSEEWWDQVHRVFCNLAMTRRTPDDPEVAKFWINIICDATGRKWIGGGGSMPGHPVDVKAYDGWLIPFLTGRRKINAEDLTSSLSLEVSSQKQRQNRLSERQNEEQSRIRDELKVLTERVDLLQGEQNNLKVYVNGAMGEVFKELQEVFDKIRTVVDEFNQKAEDQDQATTELHLIYRSVQLRLEETEHSSNELDGRVWGLYAAMEILTSCTNQLKAKIKNVTAHSNDNTDSINLLLHKEGMRGGEQDLVNQRMGNLHQMLNGLMKRVEKALSVDEGDHTPGPNQSGCVTPGGNV